MSQRPATASSRRRRCAAAGALLAVLVCTPAQAGRGLELNAFSAEGVGMGGADVAVARDTAAVNINPAGLTQIDGHTWDVSLYPYDALDVRHQDALGNDAGLSQRAGLVFSGGYAQHLKSMPALTFGIGLFAQGGTGEGYDALKTNFGTRDKLSSNFGVFKLVSGVGWRVNERLSVGASAGLSYAMGREKFFPETSNAASSFFGLRFDGGKTYMPNFLVGVQYHPVPEWTLAATYVSKIQLPLTGGRATVDFDAIGLGHVNYRHARIDGFALPQEIDAGVAWRPAPRWLLALEFNWLDYSGALRTARLRAHGPDNGSAPASLDAATPLFWHDLYVFAAGAAFELDSKTTLRGGFNFENNPVPGENATPILNLSQRRDVAVGFGRKLAGGWAFDATVEYQPGSSQTYHNPTLPLGPSSKDHFENMAVLLALSQRW